MKEQTGRCFPKPKAGIPVQSHNLFKGLTVEGGVLTHFTITHEGSGDGLLSSNLKILPLFYADIFFFKKTLHALGREYDRQSLGTNRENKSK